MIAGGKRGLTFTAIVACVLLASTSFTLAQQRSVNFYNWSNYMAPGVLEQFTKETGIKVTYRQGGDTELGNQLIAEGDSSPADVFLTENSPAMAAVEDAAEREALHEELALEHEKIAGGVDSAIEIGVVDEKIDPAHTRSKITQALAEAPARRGRHKNIAL